ncbi:DUF4179 domain-containing protein [Paenibacillus oleatilyticus]|uniref:DUF4179 domain-containing protein n=1 Tax=Paenibacillus oleatilyticus TaxID=2594886 RepID=UPI001C1F302A|nr:DUF4179 domain-containing protein [Paenibacillus oleatilyticus]MBU7318780.1 DUF4179 domain-containing protein [Paenibacillus oleatilyticus]
MSISDEIKQSLTEQFDKTQVPEDVDRRVRQSFVQFHEKKENKKMKKTIIAFSIAAAVLIPTGAYSLSSSYFAQDQADISGLVGSGVKRAVSEGLSVPIDHKITDQGITIHFKEMYVEDTKVLVHYRIEKQDGTLVPWEFDTTGLQIISDGKKDGKQVDNPTYQEPGVEGFNRLNFIGRELKDKDYLTFRLTDAAGKEIETGVADKDKPEGTIGFVMKGGASLPQTIKLSVDIDRIGKTKGSWKGDIAIDQSKAKQATEAAKDKEATEAAR